MLGSDLVLLLCNWFLLDAEACWSGILVHQMLECESKHFPNVIF